MKKINRTINKSKLFLLILVVVFFLLPSQHLRTNRPTKMNDLSSANNMTVQIHSNTSIKKAELEFPKNNLILDIHTPKKLNTPTVYEFPLGWYDRVDRLKGIDIMAEQGFNLIMPYVNYSKKDYSKIRAYLDRAFAKDIKVLLELFRGDIKNNNLDQITKFVRTFKDHPAVYGWYLYDEPVIKGIQPEQLNTIYKIIKAETPQKPVTLLFHPQLRSFPSKPFASYWNAFDIFMGEWYPGFFGESEFQKLKVYGSSLRRVKDFAGSKPFITVLQAFGRDDIEVNRKTKWRYPTLKEERYMIYNAIVSGTKGLFFYAYHRNSPSWTTSILMPLVKELKIYLPAIINGLQTNKVSVDLLDVDVKFYLYPNQSDFLIIAVNHKNDKIRTSFSLSKTINSKAIQNTVNQEQIKISDHQFIDSFDAYGVHIYRGKL